MKKLLLLCLLLISITSCTLQSMLNNCPLCLLITEYENAHPALYTRTPCLFCEIEVDDEQSYKLLNIKDQTFRIHNDCFPSMKNTFTYDSTPLCDNCTGSLSQLEKEKALFHEGPSQDEPSSDEYEPVGRCRACSIVCCPFLLLPYWNECACSKCPGVYCFACKLAYCPRE